jgi:hypothetical protein
LQLSVYQADDNSFDVTSVLVSGQHDAILIDSVLPEPMPTALPPAFWIAASSSRPFTSARPTRTTTLRHYPQTDFPQGRIAGRCPTLARIQANVTGKMAFWGPKMGDNAPSTPLALPHALKGSRLMLEGQSLEVRGSTGVLAHRGYVWIPSIRAIVGNVGVVSGLHVWTADTQSKEERQAWLAQLDEMEALQPKQVIPGHMAANAPTGLASIRYTRSYLQQFEQNLALSRNSGELIQRMQQAFPQAGEAMSLEIGAKVNKGEMKW